MRATQTAASLPARALRAFRWLMLIGWLLPTAAPSWAARVVTMSPQGDVAQVRQARVGFSDPMVPFGDPRLPAPFDVRCDSETPLGGEGRWVDDRNWVHDFAEDVPTGTRCQFEPRAGLTTLTGEAIAGLKPFGFATGGPAVVRAWPSADKGSDNDGGIDEEQVFALLLNGPATPASIERQAWCEVSGLSERLPVQIVDGPARAAILKKLGLERRKARVTTLRCGRPVPPAAKLTLVWARGIATPSGAVNAIERRLVWTVRSPFTATFRCERVKADADCLPIRPLRIEFSAPVPRALAERVLLRLPDGERKAQFETADGEGNKIPGAAVESVVFAGPFAERSALRIELPGDLRDDAGRPLANAAQFPLAVRTGEAPPLAKFPRGRFGILEARAETVLPITLRHVEGDLAIRAHTPAGAGSAAGSGTGGSPVRDLLVGDDAAIIAWLSRVERYDEASLPRTEVEGELGIQLPPSKDKWVETRSVSLLGGQAAARRLQLPADSRTEPHPFEVVGIPLPQHGFHVVEVESRRLGQSLLGRDAPMYVRTSVLVTNLGVHFKWGSVNSAVWVTTLDQAKPVAGARVQVSDCLGQLKWHGSTDANGVAMIQQALPQLDWRVCQDRAAYFVSARATDDQGSADMAFVLSSWTRGIEPWRFHLPWRYGSSSEPAIFHSVLDRTLLRAGQTVSMKHYARAEALVGLRLPAAAELPQDLRIVHQGSGQEFKVPLEWRGGRYAESVFKIPEDAKLGTYRLSLVRGDRDYDTGNFRVEEFRLPLLTGRIVGPKAALVQPRSVPLGLQISYANGGGAAGLAVRVSAQLGDADLNRSLRIERYPGYRFAPPRQPGRPAWGSDDADSEDESDGPASAAPGDARSRLVADKLAVTLDRQGAANLVLPGLPALDRPRQLLVQANYADPNGEIQTLSQTLPVWPSGLVLGVRTESWVLVGQQVATRVIVLDTTGAPQAGVRVRVIAKSHQVQSQRRRLVGGFYAYDNQTVDTDLGEVCNGTSDARGLLLCTPELTRAGEIELVAEALDAGGHPARAADSVWVNRAGEIWFGGENQDRMDVIPERRDYQPGERARFQVRSPFRQATALVAIERNGVLETVTMPLDGKNPTIEIPVKAEWAPNVFISVLAVRGRVSQVPWYSFFSWGWRTPGDWWRARQAAGETLIEPTAMVDLAKPAFKFGIAEIEVGQAAHRLKVEVLPDQASYPIRATSQVRVRVTLPGGAPAPAGSEVALAAVDEALLELRPNASWDLRSAMIRWRGYAVDTATAQMQIIGKRHYGKKAAPPGGGGGAFPSRELFDTLLLWNPRVVLDARGEAVVAVPLNDALTSFRIVAIADVVLGDDAALFGTGRASIRSTQDLQILSGVPPLVREGDRYRALFTLRNTTGQPMQVVLGGQAGAALAEQRVDIAAQSAAEVGWDVTAPRGGGRLDWRIDARAGAARDSLKFSQQIGEAVPVKVQQATLVQLEGPQSLAIAPPAGAASDAGGALRGGIELALKPRLSDGLPGVAEYFARYPWSCLEQQTSIAIGRRDVAAWRALARQLPLYLDEDGLANYFPPDPGQVHTGSDTLTAYLLAISDEASRLGLDFSIPADSRERMQRGLLAFVEGRLERREWFPPALPGGDLTVRKLAALEALSRHLPISPRLLGSLQIAPNQWPTSALLDWLMLLGRAADLPERDRRLAEAEQILRARLNVQGTRLGFSTERDDNWWWLMVNGDVNSQRMILGIVDKPGWKADLPRLVIGALQRQSAGHWSTTVANAWGSLAIEAYAKRFEREAVTGRTQAGFEPGTNSASFDWQKQPGGGSLSLGWPATPGATLRLAQQGTGAPWLTISSRAAVPVLAPFGSAYRISKTVTPVDPAVRAPYARGDVLRVHLDIDVQVDSTWVVVDDPVPGGSAILGNGLGRDSAIDSAPADARRQGRGSARPAYQERRLDAFRAYYRYLPKGRLSLDYTVRLNNPGTFQMPATRVEAMYAPEMFGESPNAPVVVRP